MRQHDIQLLKPSKMLEGAEDQQRARAIICVASNLDDPKVALNIMEMLGLIDGKGEYVAADEITSHINNPHRRGIGGWIS